MSKALADNLVHFVRYLRSRGLAVVPETTADLLRAAETVGLADRHDAYAAFRAVTVARPEELPVFDEAFELFFGTAAAPTRSETEEIDLPSYQRDFAPVKVPVIGMEAESEDDRRDLRDTTGGSYLERLGRRDFGDLTPEEVAEVRRLIARMVWEPAEALSRRWRPARRGRRPDFRRTFRGLMSSEGDLMPLALAERRRRRRPVLIIADVSGSMERYVDMLIYFIHAAQGRMGRVETFVFSTRLTRITREIRHRDPRVALSRVGERVGDWSGGTRIGDALHTFNWEWSRRVSRGGPIALIISDGWDCGDPALLRNEMALLARSVHRVVWLNPLAGRPGYEPATRGMQAALPHVDDFLPAATVFDLRGVVRLLESVPSRRTAIAHQPVG